MIENFNYITFVIMMISGLYVTISSQNLIKKLLGLSIFQTSVLLFYISLGFIKGGKIPVLKAGQHLYHNPLPQVLMLTAIVVGVATISVGFALVIRIKQQFNSIEENVINAKEQ